MAFSIGLMNESFFVGRGELLAWINGLLSLQLTKVEAVRSHPGAPAVLCKSRARAARLARACGSVQPTRGARCVAQRAQRRAAARPAVVCSRGQRAAQPAARLAR